MECASPSIPEEQHAAWVARVKTWVRSPEARNQIRGAAAIEYREDMSRRGMRHVGDPAVALFPEMEMALMEKWDAAIEKGSKLTQMWIYSNARHLARRLYPAPHPKAERAGKFKACQSWLVQGLAVRHFLGVRSRTNFKKRGLREMLPKYHRYLRNLKLRFLPVRDEHDVPIVPGHPLFDNLTPEQRKWGRFPVEAEQHRPDPGEVWWRDEEDLVAAWGAPRLDQKLHGRERRQARLHVATAHSWRQTAGTSDDAAGQADADLPDRRQGQAGRQWAGRPVLLQDARGTIGWWFDSGGNV